MIDHVFLSLQLEIEVFLHIIVHGDMLYTSDIFVLALIFVFG